MTRDDAQIECLISELADGTLDPARRAEVRAALAADAALRARAAAYERLAARLRAWRVLTHAVDSPALTDAIRGRIEQQQGIDAAPAVAGMPVESRNRRPARGPRTIDDLIDAWAGPHPPVDWNALHARISAGVRREAAARGRGWRRRAVGLALAASLALAAMLWWLPSALNRGASPTLPSGVTTPVVRVEIDMPRQAGRAVVRFDESPPPGYEPLPPAQRSSGFAIVPTPRRAPRPDDDPNF